MHRKSNLKFKSLTFVNKSLSVLTLVNYCLRGLTLSFSSSSSLSVIVSSIVYNIKEMLNHGEYQALQYRNRQ